MNNKFAFWPYFADDEIAAVNRVLKSGKVNYWTGEECKLFEKEFAEFIGCKYAISLANGTLALELALHALGIGSGDEVIVPARTFIATASAVVACGARPVVADVDPVSQNLTARTIAAVLTPKTKAVIPVHLAGWPCDMDPILDLAECHKLKVIEDCAQAHGAKYKNKYAGSLGDVAAFSFCQDKIMTTGGEGGMLLTNDRTIWEKAWSYKDHGKNSAKSFAGKSGAGFRWLHESFGSNWRMTEMQAAIGRVQLSKLTDWVAKRQHNAKILEGYFKDIPFVRLTPSTLNQDVQHAYYKYYVFIDPQKLPSSLTRDMILARLAARGVPCGSGTCGEIYLEEAFQKAGLILGQRLPIAKELSETSLMFVVHPTLSADNMHQMGAIMREVLLASF